MMMAEKKGNSQSDLPVLIMEYSFTISQVLVVIVTVLTVVLSLIAGSSWKTVLFRAGSVTLVLGFLLYWLNLLIVDGSLDVIFKRVAALREKEKHSNTQEWKV
jgi:hypothetical protein